MWMFQPSRSKAARCSAIIGTPGVVFPAAADFCVTVISCQQSW
jgi:hypothetical protein